MENIQLPKYEDMVKAGVHFGRKKSFFHPRMKPFVYALKEGVYILDLIQTNSALVKALAFLKEAKKEGKTILFVGTTKQSVDAVKETAEALTMPYVVNRWLGGTLTNFKTLISRVKHLEDLETQKATGGWERFTKKERLLKDKEIRSLKVKFDGIRKMTKIPDVVFVTSLKDDVLAVKEAQKSGVKVVAIVNTDGNPDEATFPIPANTNSKKSIQLILEAVKNELL